MPIFSPSSSHSPPAFSIDLAVSADIEGMVRVVTRALEQDPLNRALFSPSPNESQQLRSEMSRLNLSNNIQDDKMRVFKATLTDGGARGMEIVGFGVLQYHTGDTMKEGDSKDAPTKASVPPGMSEELIQHYWTSVMAKQKEHLKGQKHVVCGSLHVLPEYRQYSVDSKLLQWAFAQFELENDLLWTVTPLSGRDVFTKFGLVEVDVLDIDLGKWAGKNKGVDIYRSVCLLRHSGKLL